jgi:hypothetical protein
MKPGKGGPPRQMMVHWTTHSYADSLTLDSMERVSLMCLVLDMCCQTMVDSRYPSVALVKLEWVSVLPTEVVRISPFLAYRVYCPISPIRSVILGPVDRE